jgi:hypothetical protein
MCLIALSAAAARSASASSAAALAVATLVVCSALAVPLLGSVVRRRDARGGDPVGAQITTDFSITPRAKTLTNMFHRLTNLTARLASLPVGGAVLPWLTPWGFVVSASRVTLEQPASPAPGRPSEHIVIIGVNWIPPSEFTWRKTTWM